MIADDLMITRLLPVYVVGTLIIIGFWLLRDNLWILYPGSK